MADGKWVKAADLDAVRAAGRMVVKKAGKQILLLAAENGIFASNNRCPHEGFPLSEATLDCPAILTCNWHNWKFDLASGETLVGGDLLRRYPVEVRDGAVWLDVSDPPVEEVARRALASLRDALDDYDYTRMARELARLALTGRGAETALTAVIGWTYDHLEYGTVHGFGGAADWLALSDEYAANDADRMAAVLEITAHIAWDSLRQPCFPFTEEVSEYDAGALVEAIEREDEPCAVALARGALHSGFTYADLRQALARAALAHYADFGHSAIYVCKTGSLAGRLGPEAAEPLLLALIRSLIYARREDLLPEFRAYHGALRDWTGQGDAPVLAEDFIGCNVEDALALTQWSSGRPRELYDALLGAAAWNMLHFDTAFDLHTDLSVASNAGWLDFSHAITFASAARMLCDETPDLWPAALLQMALFVGRNVRFIDKALDGGPWQVDDPGRFMAGTAQRLFDHGEFRHIFAIHQVKLFQAVREELAAAPDAPWRATLLAAFNRFMNSPMRGRHVRRSVKQAMTFVAAEGWRAPAAERVKQAG